MSPAGGVYESNWKRLSDAVQLVLAHAGISENDAKNGICQGIAEGTIGIRCKLRKHATRPMTSEAILEGKAFQIPDVIQSSDLDWEGSRALAPWFVKRDAFSPAGHWHLAWIKLSKTDLSRVFFRRGDATKASAEEGMPADQSGSQPEGIRPLARAGSAPRRGRRATKFNATVTAMRDHIRLGQLTAAQLEGMLEKDLAPYYGVSRDTARKARITVLSELNSRQNPTIDN